MPFGKFFTDGWTTTLNIYSQVGLVTLVGLVSKNGILIVQFANQLQRQGLAKLAAVAQAARIRLRPIMMTSVATVAGHFPLTLVSGAGAAARNSIGLVLVGGMTIWTIFTLFIVGRSNQPPPPNRSQFRNTRYPRWRGNRSSRPGSPRVPGIVLSRAFPKRARESRLPVESFSGSRDSGRPRLLAARAVSASRSALR